MRVVIDSEVWEIIDDGTSLPEKDADGDIDSDIRTILIHPCLRPACRLKVLIHEILHASCEWMAESTATTTAEDIARVLYQQYKYRCPKPKGKKQ